MVENMLARDAQVGISAFIEKRAPQWQDEQERHDKPLQ